MGTYKIENNIGTCPICGEEMGDLDIEHSGREVNEGYSCHDCGIIVSYIWTLPEPSRAELMRKSPDEVTGKQLDRAEQAERWARDTGKMIIERG